MTAPTVNGTRYPQPVDELLPAARKLADELGEIPSRNRLMRTYRIGAPKADELRTRLTRDSEAELRARLADQFGYAPPDERRDTEADEPPADPWQYAEPIDLDPLDAAPDDEPDPGTRPDPAPVPAEPEPVEAAPAVEESGQVTASGHPGTETPAKPVRRLAVWPVVLLSLPAFVAVWSGWVGLGKLTGFGKVDLLPGIAPSGGWATIDSAITLPIGVETYAAYALYVWLSGRVPERARRFAKWSAIGSLVVGSLGQVAYHLLVAAKVEAAPWWITTLVACLPVAVLGMGAALGHMVREES